MASTVFTRFFALALFCLSCSSSLLHAQGGYTLDFDGTTTYGTTSSMIPFGTTMTLEAWIRTDTVKIRNNIMAWGTAANTQNTIEFRTASTKLEFGINDGSAWFPMASSADVVDGEWHHVVVVKNGSSVSLYIDGKLDNTATISAVATVDMTTVGVLQHFGTLQSDSHFNGDIDELRVWNDVRTQAEIQGNMHKELAGNEANLIAYYQMSNGSGTSLTDNSTNSYTGTLANSPTWKTSGALAGPDMALDFDGTDDEVTASITTTATDTITIETWIKFKSLTGQQNPMRFQQSATFTRLTFTKEITTNLLGLYINDGSSGGTINTTIAAEANQWYHLAYIYAEDSVIIYINGEKVLSQFTALNFRTTASNDFWIGASNGTYEGDVIIDEVRIWDDIRTEAEIRANKDRTLSGNEANLVAYYRMDQQPATGHTTVYDLTGNGGDGTLSNMDATSDWVTSSPFNTWIGSEDGDWGNADNWSNGAVPSGEDVGVYDWNATTNAPATGNISARNFYVDAAASISHSGDLTLSDNFTNEGTFETSGRVTFSGTSAQTIRGTGSNSFGSWTVNNAAGVTLESALTITSSLTLSAGIVDLNSQTLTINSAASLSGVPGNSNHVDATSGTLRKGYSGTGSFSFPVGDGTYYSPISLNFTSGNFSSAFADINLTTAKHPNNNSTGNYIERYWSVSSSGISSFSCDVVATYLDEDTVGIESEYYGGKYSSEWTLLGPVSTGSNQITGTVTGFSDFTAGELSAFPVEWLSFEAKSATQGVDLSWATASESNSHYFGVERSSDLGTWTEIGQVDAAGFSTQESQYLFTDLFPTSGENLYRLRQVDFDGKMDYSEVRSVWINENLRLYPNPVLQTLNLDLPTGEWQATMFDQQGRQVRTISQVGSSINMENMPTGVYYLLLENGQGQRMSERVVRQ